MMNSYSYFKLLFLLTPLCLLPLKATAEGYELNTLIRTNFPTEAKKNKVTLFKYILEGTGYSVYIGPNAPSDAINILKKKAGFIRKGLLTRRYDALLLVAGKNNSIVIDHDNKLISVTESSINE